IVEIVLSGSYSTSIRFIASNATSSSTAATAATGSPMKRTLSTQSACSSWLTGRMPYGIGKSFPVTTAKTPGKASAFETSMLLINACGRCERRILQNNMRGSTMSSANFVWPTHFARASTLRKGLPIILKSLATDLHGFLATHARGGELYCLIDFYIAGTTTQIT